MPNTSAAARLSDSGTLASAMRHGRALRVGDFPKTGEQETQ